MNKNIIWILLLFLLVVNVSAQDYRLYGKQNTDVPIIDHCYDAGANCPATIDCNITINNEAILLVNNKVMSNNGFFLNYTFTNTSQIGKYQASVVCSNAGTSSFDNFFFRITYSGNEPLTTGEVILYAISFIFFLMAGIGLLVWALTINTKNKYKVGEYLEINYAKYLKLFMFFLSYLSFWIFTFITSTLAEDYLELPLIQSIFMFIFKTMGYLIVPVLMVLSVVAFVDWLADVKLHKLAKRGLNER